MTFNLDTTDYPNLGYLILIWTGIWVLTLGLILSRRDFDAITRLTWVVVVIFVPVFGVFLYAFVAPERWSPKKADHRDNLYGTPWEGDSGHTVKKAGQET
jgi:heme/copper-type cytochrome/quinol oxidase subunit 2